MIKEESKDTVSIDKSAEKSQSTISDNNKKGKSSFTFCKTSPAESPSKYKKSNVPRASEL